MNLFCSRDEKSSRIKPPRLGDKYLDRFAEIFIQSLLFQSAIRLLKFNKGINKSILNRLSLNSQEAKQPFQISLFQANKHSFNTKQPRYSSFSYYFQPLWNKKVCQCNYTWRGRKFFLECGGHSRMRIVMINWPDMKNE